jgi:hypothetical protein
MLQNRLYYSQSKMFSLSKKKQEDEALCRSIGWTYGRAIPYFHFGVRVDIMATQTKTRAAPFSYCKCVTEHAPLSCLELAPYPDTCVNHLLCFFSSSRVFASRLVAVPCRFRADVRDWEATESRSLQLHKIGRKICDRHRRRAQRPAVRAGGVRAARRSRGAASVSQGGRLPLGRGNPAHHTL